eukprot:comp23428_c1_seq1/m.38992 comp23428_c1_seq1/g.38992  ORF comp23428_c1_seq1/g.38992 comp23428_c1_seq1/m.38992 type:complete len:373 (-) comp23428_c1_seq1:85-1203(-)
MSSPAVEQEAVASTSAPAPAPRPSTENGLPPVAAPRPSTDSTTQPPVEPRKSVSGENPKVIPVDARASSTSYSDARASVSSLSADRKLEPAQPRPPAASPKQIEPPARAPTNPSPTSAPPGPPSQPSAPPRPRKEASNGKEVDGLTHSRKNTYVAGNLLPLSREVLLKPYAGEHGEETRLNTGRFMEHINNMRGVIHSIKVEKFPDEVAREVAELQRKKEKRPVSNMDEHTLLPSEVEAAKSDTRTLYALLVEDPQLALRRDFLWGYTLLHWAAKANNLRSVRLLLEAGADPRAQSHGGLTPLHTAAMGDKTDQIVQILMEKGADVDMKTNSGLKARDVARGEKRFLLQSRLDCWDFKVVKQVIPNLKSVYM